MDLGSAIKVLLRQWLVVLIGLILTLGAGAYLYTSAPPSYQTSARMLLLLPADARGTEQAGSPFLYLPTGLNVLARIVSVKPTSRDFREDMDAQGFSSSYEVGVDPTSPVITVSVEGPDPDNVSATRVKLTEAIKEELLRVQAEEGAPAKQTAHARVYDEEEVPQPVSGSGLRGIIALIAVGAIVTLLLAFAIDRASLLLRQRRRRSPMRAAEEDPEMTMRQSDEEHTVPDHTEPSETLEELTGRHAAPPHGSP